MKAHWENKWMSIPYNKLSIMLALWISACQDQGPILQLMHITESKHLSLTIWFLLPCSTSNVFTSPTDLPPYRKCDHTIPLIEGARLANIHPYRYAPAIKEEIERQVDEMLQKGMIQESSNAFSSPVLLVKKDNTYRFCVDFWHLMRLQLRANIRWLSLMNFWTNCLGLAGSPVWIC